MRLPALAALLASLAVSPAASQDRPFASFDAASAAVLHDPHDLAFGPDGRLYVADKFADAIAVFDPDTLEQVAVLGAGRFPNVHDISFGRDGRVAVAVTGSSLVAVFSGADALEGEPLFAVHAARSEGALLHSNGRLYAMASGSGRIGAFDDSGLVAVAEGHYGAHDLAEGPGGSVWVADTNNRRVVRYSADLRRELVLEGPEFGFAGPRYLDVTPDGRLVVADQDAHRVLLIEPDAPEGLRLVGVLGTGAPGLGANLFDDPEGVAFQGGRYFISDSDNNRIVRYVVLLN
ncbi:NHL repeat-containing protein [Oceaniglobus roseus]|uniref:Vgb family protein n=1 Tax=Oceaniglobus roseus TaxID=1737570 RepID=UPI000C7E9B6C|nr:NHL repeat-containing protein [Kandeliimicrobium roseum]